MSSSDCEEEIQKSGTTDMHDDLPVQQATPDAWQAWSGNGAVDTNPLVNSRHLVVAAQNSDTRGLADRDKAAINVHREEAAGFLLAACKPGLNSSDQALQLAKSQLSTTKFNQIANKAKPVNAQKPRPSMSPMAEKSSTRQNWTPQPRGTGALPASWSDETPSPPAIRERKRGIETPSFQAMPTAKTHRVITPAGNSCNLCEMETKEMEVVEEEEVEAGEGKADDKKEEMPTGETEAGDGVDVKALDVDADEEEQVEEAEMGADEEEEVEDEESELEELEPDEPVDGPIAEQAPPEATATESPDAKAGASTAAAMKTTAKAKAAPKADAAPKAKAGAKAKAKAGAKAKAKAEAKAKAKAGAKAKAKAKSKARSRAKNGEVGCFAGNRPPTGANANVLFRLKKLLHSQICEALKQKHSTKNLVRLGPQSEINFNSFVMGRLKKTADNLNVKLPKLGLLEARDEIKTSSDQWKSLVDAFIQDNDTVDLKKLPTFSENN